MIETTVYYTLAITRRGRSEADNERIIESRIGPAFGRHGTSVEGAIEALWPDKRVDVEVGHHQYVTTSDSTG